MSIGLVTNVLVTVGSSRAVTVRLAEPAVGSGALSNVTVNAALVRVPAAPVTSTAVVTVQLPPGARVALDIPIVLPPAVPPEMLAVEPGVQLIVTDAGVVLFTFPGYVSVKTAPLRTSVVVVFGLAIVIEIVEMSLAFTDDGAKDFATVGAATTVNGAEAGLPATASPARVTPDVVFV